MMDVEILISHLQLQPHPEGGFFKEIYRAPEFINVNELPSRYLGKRNFSTSIYFLLNKNDKSHFHKIQSDEIWHFYLGSTVLIHQIDENGKYYLHRLGKNILEGECLQIIIQNNTWFAAEVEDKNSYGLIGCTVAPGFDFHDFELAKRNELANQFPNFKKLIENFTKK